MRNLQRSKSVRGADRSQGWQLSSIDQNSRHLSAAFSPLSRLPNRQPFPRLRLSMIEHERISLQLIAKHPHSRLNGIDTELSPIDRNPAASQLLSYDGRCSSSGKSIQHDIISLAACLDNPLEQRLGLDRRVSDTLDLRGVNSDIPDIILTDAVFV